MVSADKLTRVAERGPAKWLALLLNLSSGLALMAMMIITCIDVVGRYFLNKPMVGAIELNEILLGVMIFTALPVISWRNEQVVVDILDGFVPPLMHFVRSVLFNILATIALGVIGSRIYLLGERANKHGEITEYLGISVGHVIMFFGVMCWFTAITLITLGMYRAYHQYQLSRDSSGSLSTTE